MRRRPPRSLGWLAGMTAAFLVIAAVLGPSAMAAPKLVHVSLTRDGAPEPVPAGSNANLSITVSPESGTIASFTLTAPDGFTPTLVVETTAGHASISGDSLQVSNVKIGPSSSVTVRFTARAACMFTSYAWSLVAFDKGGDPYDGVTADSDLATSVGSPSDCTLTFAGEQPTSAIVDHVITTVAYSQVLGISAANVAVTVLRGDGTLDRSFNRTISLSLANDPGPDDATLYGGISTNAVQGVASFTPQIDREGGGYVLGATSPEVSDGSTFASRSFAIQRTYEQCAPNTTCRSPLASGAEISTEARANSPASGAVVTSGVADGDVDCPTYVEASEEEATTEYTGSGTVLVTDYLAKTVVHSDINNGISQIRTCFASSHEFAGSTLDETTGMWVGLLEPCNNRRPVPPCETAKFEMMSGVGVIQYLINAGDPLGRH